MATGEDDANLKTCYNKFVKGDQATSRDMTKWFTDSKVFTKKTCNSNNLDIAFNKIKEKKQT
jgi:hypothetical protein